MLVCKLVCLIRAVVVGALRPMPWRGFDVTLPAPLIDRMRLVPDPPNVDSDLPDPVDVDSDRNPDEDWIGGID